MLNLKLEVKDIFIFKDCIVDFDEFDEILRKKIEEL
jgi:hypothetical protein